MDRRPNRRNKTAFSNFPGVERTGLKEGARKLPGDQILKIKRYGKGLTSTVSMEDGGSGPWAPASAPAHK